MSRGVSVAESDAERYWTLLGAGILTRVTDGCMARQAFELASLELGLVAMFKLARAARDRDRSASLGYLNSAADSQLARTRGTTLRQPFEVWLLLPVIRVARHR